MECIEEKAVMDGDLFIKYAPADNRQTKQYLREYYEDLEKHHIKVITPDGKNPADSISDFDRSGMDKLWLLKVINKNYLFVSLENDPKVNNSYNLYNSVEEALKEYRSLRNIIANEPFIGKKLEVSDINGSVYSLYELTNVVILASFNEDGSIDIIRPIYKEADESLTYDKGAPKLIIKNPYKLIDSIYRNLN
jgi:hypothetical protein